MQDQLLTLTHDGATHIEADPAWLRAQGVPEEVIAAALAAVHARAASVECRRRIYAEASAEAQTNMSLAAGVFGAVPVEERSDDETAILAGARAALQWVTSMRDAFMQIAADPDADYLADAAWPPLDPAVQAMIKTHF